MGSSSQPSTSTLSVMADLSEPVFEDTSSVPEQEDVLQETKSQRKKRLAQHKKDMFKKERDKKKLLKLHAEVDRHMEQTLPDSMKKYLHKEKKKVKKSTKLDDKPPMWEEAIHQALLVNKTIDEFLTTVTTAHTFINGEGDNLSEDLKRELSVHCSILSNDSEELRKQWLGYTTSIEGKKGVVTEDEIADYLAIYTDLMNLQQMSFTTLEPTASRITEIILDYSESKKVENADGQ